jgi:hypothetical protein
MSPVENACADVWGLILPSLDYKSILRLSRTSSRCHSHTQASQHHAKQLETLAPTQAHIAEWNQARDGAATCNLKTLRLYLTNLLLESRTLDWVNQHTTRLVSLYMHANVPVSSYAIAHATESLHALRHFECHGSLTIESHRSSSFPLAISRLPSIVTCIVEVRIEEDLNTEALRLESWTRLVAYHSPQHMTRLSLEINFTELDGRIIASIWADADADHRNSQAELVLNFDKYNNNDRSQPEALICLNSQRLERLELFFWNQERHKDKAGEFYQQTLVWLTHLPQLTSLRTNVHLASVEECHAFLALPCMTHVTTLDLSNYAWPVENWPIDVWAHCLAPSMLPCLTDLSLMADIGRYYATLDHLPVYPHLTRLSLSAMSHAHVNEPNHLRTALSKQPRLRSLKLDNGFEVGLLRLHIPWAILACVNTLRDLSIESQDVLVDMARSDIPLALQSLHLTQCTLWEEMRVVLPTTLERLSVEHDNSYCVMTDKELAQLAQACPRMRDLDLRSCRSDRLHPWHVLTDPTIWPNLERLALPVQHAKDPDVLAFSRARPLQVRLEWGDSS